MLNLAPSWHPVGGSINLDNDLMRLANFCKEERSFQEMMGYMGWQDRTKFRRRFVLPLLEKNILKRTIPEKPSSSKQRYIITMIAVEILKID